MPTLKNFQEYPKTTGGGSSGTPRKSISHVLNHQTGLIFGGSYWKLSVPTCSGQKEVSTDRRLEKSRLPVWLCESTAGGQRPCDTTRSWHTVHSKSRMKFCPAQGHAQQALNLRAPPGHFQQSHESALLGFIHSSYEDVNISCQVRVRSFCCQPFTQPFTQSREHCLVSRSH